MPVTDEQIQAEIARRQAASQAATAQPAQAQSNDFGLRPDNTPKGNGFLGVLNLPDGGVATEFSTQSNAVVDAKGNRFDFPSLVPTLSKDQINLMVNDIIPNKKNIPNDIMQKAVDFALERQKGGLSVFAGQDESPPQRGVTDLDIQAEIARRKQEQAVSQSPSREGTELGSVPVTEEGIQEREALEREVAGSRRDLEINTSARDILSPDFALSPKSLIDTDAFALLETVNLARNFRDKKKRAAAVNELRRRGIPNEFIQTFTELDDAKGFIAGLKEESPETIGGIIGSGIGAVAGKGSPKAQRRGAIIGAAAGAGLTELGREVFEREFRPERARSALDLTKDTAFTAVSEGLGEAGGRFVIDPILGTLGRFFAKEAIPGAGRISKEIAEAGRQVAEEGGASPLLGTKLPIATGRIGRAASSIGFPGSPVSANLDPSQQSASRIVSTLVGLTEETFFGGGRLAKAKEIAQPAAIPKFISNKIDDITGGLDILPLDEIGVITQDAIHGSKVSGQRTRGASGAFNAVRRTIFDDVTKRIPNPVDISSAQQIAQGIIDSSKKGGSRLKLPEKTEAILQRVVDTGTSKKMSDLIFSRSDIGDLIRAAELADEPKVGQVLAPVMNDLTRLMTDAAGKVGPSVQADLKRALLFSGEGKGRFSSSLIRKLQSERMPAEKLVRAVFGAPGDETLSPLSSVRNVKEVLLGSAGKTPGEITSDKFAWDQLRFKWLATKVKTASDEIGVPGSKRFGDILSNFGDEALSEMFSKQELVGIEDIKFALQLKGKKSRKIASLIVKSAQVGAVGGGLASGKEGLALASLGGPAVLGQFLSSDLGRKFLTTGISKGTTGTISGIEGQFIAGMLRTKEQMNQRKKRFDKHQGQINMGIQNRKRGASARKRKQRVGATQLRQQQEQPFRIR